MKIRSRSAAPRRASSGRVTCRTSADAANAKNAAAASTPRPTSRRAAVSVRSMSASGIDVRTAAIAWPSRSTGTAR